MPMFKHRHQRLNIGTIAIVLMFEWAKVHSQRKLIKYELIKHERADVGSVLPGERVVPPFFFLFLLVLVSKMLRNINQIKEAIINLESVPQFLFYLLYK